MEREKTRKFKKIVQVAVFGGTAVALAALARVGERHDKTPSDEAVDVKSFESGEEQIAAARETDEQIIFQNDTRETSRWEATVKQFAKVTPPPEPTINIVGEYQASQFVPTSEAQVENPVNFVGEAALEKYQTELPQILKIAEANKEIFLDIESLAMYYPIYRAAEDKFQVPWELLYITHGEESTYSQDPNAFVIKNDQFGAMGRNILYHPQEDVDKFFEGMDFLDRVPTRDPTDPEEIIYAAREYFEWSIETGGLRGAIGRYCRADIAERRWEKYCRMSALFDIPAQ